MDTYHFALRLKSLLLGSGIVVMGSHAILLADAKHPPAPAPETKEQHDARMAWWREAKFGLFLHWAQSYGTIGR